MTKKKLNRSQVDVLNAAQWIFHCVNFCKTGNNNYA